MRFLGKGGGEKKRNEILMQCSSKNPRTVNFAPEGTGTFVK